MSLPPPPKKNCLPARWGKKLIFVDIKFQKRLVIENGCCHGQTSLGQTVVKYKGCSHIFKSVDLYWALFQEKSGCKVLFTIIWPKNLGCPGLSTWLFRRLHPLVCKKNVFYYFYCTKVPNSEFWVESTYDPCIKFQVLR